MTPEWTAAAERTGGIETSACRRTRSSNEQTDDGPDRPRRPPRQLRTGEQKRDQRNQRDDGDSLGREHRRLPQARFGLQHAEPDRSP
jgi:hypothetical protein